MAKKKIFISPSNQTGNKYKGQNTNEGVQMKEVADALQGILERCGFETIVMWNETVQDRVKKANSWKADAYICIHSNACNGEVMGTRMLYWSRWCNGYKLDQAIAKYLFPKSIGKSDNYNNGAQLYEVKYTNMPCAYIETEFHDTYKGAEWIVDNTELIADCIARGICDYFKVKYVPKPAPKPATKPAATTSKTLYCVQVGAFSVKENATKMAEKLKADGYSAYITIK